MMIWRIFQNLHHFGAKKSSKKWRKTPCRKILLLGPMMLDSWHLRFKLHQGNRSTFDFPQERHPFDAEKKTEKLKVEPFDMKSWVDLWIFFHLVQGVEGVNFQPLPAIDGV